jgi:hypothetical protein
MSRSNNTTPLKKKDSKPTKKVVSHTPIPAPSNSDKAPQAELQKQANQLQIDQIEFQRQKDQQALDLAQEHALLKEKELRFELEREAILQQLYQEALQLHNQTTILQSPNNNDFIIPTEDVSHTVKRDSSYIQALLDDHDNVPLQEPTNEPNNLWLPPVQGYDITDPYKVAHSILDEIEQQLHSASINEHHPIKPVIIPSYEEEPLLANSVPAEELKAQQVFERQPNWNPIPAKHQSNLRLSTILLPQLYNLFHQLAIAYTGNLMLSCTYNIDFVERMKFVVGAHCMDSTELEQKVVQKINALRKMQSEVSKEIEMINRRETIKQRLKEPTLSTTDRASCTNELRRITRQLTLILNVWKQQHGTALTYRGIDYLTFLNQHGNQNKYNMIS